MRKINKHSNRIFLSVEHKKQLIEEFNTTQPTVQLALDYYNNSELAQKIRDRALELLKNEVKKTEEKNKNFKNPN